MIIAPSVLSMDFSKVNESMDNLNQSQVEWIHFDVMDGHFVENLTFGPDVLGGLRKLTDRIMDVHLMIENPQKYASSFIKHGADQITVHIECFDKIEDLRQFVQSLKEQGVMVGLTSKPSTPVDWMIDMINEVDTVLVMSVEPGFGGQSFMESALDEIKRFSDAKQLNNSNVHIQVDGGINLKTAQKALAAGADVLVAGSYVFKGDIKENVTKLWQLSQSF